MIFDIKTSLETTGFNNKQINMSVSFCDGDKDFYSIINYELKSTGKFIKVLCIGTVCSDTYYTVSRFKKNEFDLFVKRLYTEGIGTILKVLNSLESYKVIKSGKAEDFIEESPEQMFESNETTEIDINDVKISVYVEEQYDTYPLNGSTDPIKVKNLLPLLKSKLKEFCPADKIFKTEHSELTITLNDKNGNYISKIGIVIQSVFEDDEDLSEALEQIKDLIKNNI